MCRAAFDRFRSLAERASFSVPLSSSFESYASDIFARLVEHGGADASDGELLAIWDDALSKAERSAWLRGKNDRGFKASLSFICQAKSFKKLLNGDYGNGAHARVV